MKNSVVQEVFYDADDPYYLENRVIDLEYQLGEMKRSLVLLTNELNKIGQVVAGLYLLRE